MKGIVLLATGSNLYIKMAYNLALSLTNQAPGIPICLLHDESIKELNEYQQFIFSKKILLTTEQRRNPFLVKLFLNELSPYQETLYLDVDMICSPVKKMNELFDQFKDIDFTIANRGKGVKTDWVEWDDPMWDVASEFIYWKKSGLTDTLFEIARTYYLTNFTVNRQIGGCQPDEPSISFAMNELDINPHVSPFHPSYWVVHKYEPETSIRDNYYLLSMGGNRLPDKIIKLYNKWATIHSLGSGWFPFIQKRTIKERVTL